MIKHAIPFIALFVAGIEPAFAYIDPGSGSAIMSIIIGFFVAIGVLIKSFWYKIKSILGLSSVKNTAPAQDGELTDSSSDNK